MALLDEYQVFLFDFDGLLVDTEPLHWEAYRRLSKNHGYELPFSFPEYAEIAATTSDGLKNFLAPKLGGDWESKYQEKREIYTQILGEGQIQLMPGAASLLQALAARRITRAVVTHSPKAHMDIIREQLPILNTIPEWITRECYSKPKPDPECYLKAIELLASDEDQVIGFEDSPRGLTALRGTRAQPVLVGPDGSAAQDGRSLHLNSLAEVLDSLAAV